MNQTKLENLVKHAKIASILEPRPLAYTHDQPQKYQNLVNKAESSTKWEPRPLAYTHYKPKNNFKVCWTRPNYIAYRNQNS